MISSAAHAQEFIGFDRASFGKVVLNQKQSAAGSSDMQLELAVGDYNNEPIQNYSADSVFATMGRAVGRLDILTDSKVSPVAPCTAFIVSENYLLTNHHCVPGIPDNDQVKATTIEAVKFIAGIRGLIGAVPARPEDCQVPEGHNLSPVAPQCVVHIGIDAPVQLMDYIKAAEATLDLKAELNMMPMQPGDVPVTRADAMNLEHLTGFRPETTVTDDVARFVHWYRNYKGQ